jgi:hypothetical protein
MIGIYLVYVCHINSAGLFLFVCTLPGLSGLISAVGRFRLGLFADPFCLGHQKSTNSTLLPAKDPHLGVDIINMVAPVCSLAYTVGTPKFEGLLLSMCVLVWVGSGDVAIKKAVQARKEWYPPKEVLCPANLDSRDRRGFIHLSSSWCQRFEGEDPQRR